MPDALFVPAGDTFVATALCRGPWNPDAQHGGAPAALLARTVERFEDGAEMHVARLTVELLRPVPLGSLTVTTHWARPGRRVQLVAASLQSQGVEVARALALRIRRSDLVLPAAATDGMPTPPPGPAQGRDGAPPWANLVTSPTFHRDAVEHRFVAGGFDRPGPTSDWIRLRVPVVAGEPVTPLARVAAAADFGNGISWVLSRVDGYSFVNPDLTIYVHRPPAGDWVCLEATTYVQPHGVGLAESRLWDEEGPIGRSLQSLLLDQVRR